MDIDIPKEPGSYADREFDCARALKQSFDRQVGAAGDRFLDVDRITAALTERAVGAGWTREDVRAAVMKLASNRQAADKDIQRVEAAK